METLEKVGTFGEKCVQVVDGCEARRWVRLDNNVFYQREGVKRGGNEEYKKRVYAEINGREEIRECRRSKEEK